MGDAIIQAPGKPIVNLSRFLRDGYCVMNESYDIMSA